MNSSECRAEARKKLTGKWGKAACIALAYAFITWAIGFVSGLIPKILSSFVSIGLIVIEIPLAFGLVKSYVKLYNGEDVGAFDFFSLGFNEFSKSWGVAFRTIGKLIVPFILMIVGYFALIFGVVGAGVGYVARANLVSYQSAYTPIANTMTTGFSVVGIIGAILLLVSSIWYTIKSYYYQLSYIIIADDEEITAKDAVDKSRELMDGKRWKLFVLQLSFIGWAILGVLSFGIGMLWIAPYIQCAIIAFYKYVSGNTNTVSVVEEAPVAEEPVPVIEEPAVEEPVADEPEAEAEEPEAEE